MYLGGSFVQTTVFETTVRFIEIFHGILKSKYFIAPWCFFSKASKPVPSAARALLACCTTIWLYIYLFKL
jgi:hypothetical protein